MWPHLKHQTLSFHLCGIICPLLVDHDLRTTVVADFHDLLTLGNFYIKGPFSTFISCNTWENVIAYCIYIFLLRDSQLYKEEETWNYSNDKRNQNNFTS